MESGSSSSSSSGSNNNNNNKGKNKAPATEETAASSSKQNTPPRASGLPPIPPSSSQAREQDCYMPIANVVRIMRRALPPNGKISDEAKETVQECVTEFISFITEEANQKCREDHRKTVTGEDLLWAMTRLGFDNYVDVLKPFLQKYREVEAMGLPKNEMASRQRRQANRSAGIQIGTSSSPQPVSGPGPRIGARPTGPSIMPAPAVMPPIPMIDPQQGMVSPLGNQGYFNDGSGPSSGLNVGLNSTEGGYISSPTPTLGPSPPSMSFGVVGDTNGELGGLDDLPSAETPTSSEAEMSFLDLITNFK